MATEPELAESEDPEAELNSTLAAEGPSSAPPQAEDFTPAPVPNLPPQSDQQTIANALNQTEGPPAPPQAQAFQSPAPQAQPQGNPANVMGNYDAGVADETSARKDINSLTQAQNDAQADAYAARAQMKRDQIVEREMEDQANEDARAKVVNLKQQAQDDVANFKFQDYFNDDSTGKKLGIMLGGLFAGASGNADTYMKTIQAKVAQNYQQQKDQLTSKENLLKMRDEGVQDFDQHIKDERAKLDFKQAHALDALGDEAQAQALRSGNSLVEARGKEADAQFKQAAAVKRQDAQNKVYTGELDQSKTRALDAKAAKWRGGGGTGSNNQLATVTALLAKSGGEITPEVANAAKGMKQVDLRGLASQAKGDRRVDLTEEKTTNKEASDFSKENNLPEIVKRSQSLTKINSLLSNPNVDPETQIQALQEYEKASKGGTATASSMRASLAHLAGGEDKIDQFLETVKTGGMSPEQLGNLRKSVSSALSATKDEGNTVHEAWNQTFRNMDSYPNQKPIDRLSDSYFGGLGFKRPKADSKPAASAPSPVPAPQMSKADAFKLKNFANANPDDPRAKAALTAIKAAGY